MEELGIAGLDEPDVPSFMDGGINYERTGGAQNGIAGTMSTTPRPGGVARQTANDVNVDVSFPGEQPVKTTVAQRQARPVVDNGLYPTGKSVGKPSSLVSGSGNLFREQYVSLLNSAKKAANDRMINFGTNSTRSGIANNPEPGKNIDAGLFIEQQPEGEKKTSPVEQYGLKINGKTASYMNNGIMMEIPDDVDVNDGDAVGRSVEHMNGMLSMMDSFKDEEV